jgi:hypothetical protein
MLDEFQRLKGYCEKESFQGWDPYDGLNSKIYNLLPFKRSYYLRLLWTQIFKKSPVNLRRLFLISKGHNAKGVSLFLSAYCNLYVMSRKGNIEFGQPEEILRKVNYFSELLMQLQNPDYSGSCWGYNFDWQNRETFRPKNTPTVVATSFCGEALFRAYEVTENNFFLDCALSSCDFVAKDLNRSTTVDGDLIFSYSPLDHSKVYNASLLGAKLLSIGYSYTRNREWYDLAKRATKTIIDKQQNDGSWIYGEHTVQNWKDSFHTGFNLECIWKVAKNLNVESFESPFQKGLDYYLDNFFDRGTPKYYNNKTYPIDIHSPAQLIVMLSDTEQFASQKKLIDEVLSWTIDNMQAPTGAFYYQIKKVISSKILYMRWAQAWMFKAFTEYLKNVEQENLD